MLFSSMVFILIFLPLVCVLYYIIPNRIYRNIILLISSLVFYAWGEPIYVLLMILSILVNYVFAFLIYSKTQNKTLLNKISFVLIILINLSLLGFFKYGNFFISNINLLLKTNISLLPVSLPIGISFYTFQILSYVIDVYKSKVKVQKNVINLGCYISLFPQLIAGPIVRYIDIENELNNRKETASDFVNGLRQFMIGLGSKVILANNMAFIADSIYSSYTKADTVSLWIAAIAYTFQIFFDFAGYSRMAIGIGRMFGFHFIENFNFPYVAKTITDFWRRWHISLSTWFRDYVYISLGGSRVNKTRLIFNIFITWMLTGFWHGASYNFIIWGIYYAVLLILEKLIFSKIQEKTPGFFLHIFTLFFIVMGWVIFRVENFNDLIVIVNNMFTKSQNSFFTYSVENADVFSRMIFFIPALICSLPIKGMLKIKQDITSNFQLVFPVLIFILSIVMLIASSYNPFIYFRF